MIVSDEFNNKLMYLLVSTKLLRRRISVFQRIKAARKETSFKRDMEDILHALKAPEKLEPRYYILILNKWLDRLKG